MYGNHKWSDETVVRVGVKCKHLNMYSYVSCYQPQGNVLTSQWFSIITISLNYIKMTCNFSHVQQMAMGYIAV